MPQEGVNAGRASGCVVPRASGSAVAETGEDRHPRAGIAAHIDERFHWEEPADPADPLYADPRVVALPHVAGSTEEAFGRITDVVIENLSRLMVGEPLLHRVG